MEYISSVKTLKYLYPISNISRYIDMILQPLQPIFEVLLKPSISTSGSNLRLVAFKLLRFLLLSTVSIFVNHISIYTYIHIYLFGKAF